MGYLPYQLVQDFFHQQYESFPFSVDDLFQIRCPPLDCRLVSAVPSVVLPILGAVPDGMLKPQVVVSRCGSMVCKEMVRILLVRMVLFSGMGTDAQNQAVILSWKKRTPDTKVLAEVCRWALGLALLQEVQWCYLHCHGLVLRVSMKGQRIHERDGRAWKIDEIQWSNPHVTISTGFVGSRIWALSESPFNAQVLGDPGWQGQSQGFWKCLFYFTPIQSNKKPIYCKFFCFSIHDQLQYIINFPSKGFLERWKANVDPTVDPSDVFFLR